jgi:hypothetical protein
MLFRVLVAGGHFEDYKGLRVTLDGLLANRLPDVEVVTQGGSGVPCLAASYAVERGLVLSAVVPEFGRFPPVAAVHRRDLAVVAVADAAVIVWEDRNPEVSRILELVKRKGIPVHLIGGPKPKRKAKPVIKDANQEPPPSAPCIPT